MKIIVKDGATTLGTGPLSLGEASYTNKALAKGGHGLTASQATNTEYQRVFR